MARALTPMTGVIAVVHHLERPFLGHAGQPLLSGGAALREVDRRRGDALPALGEIDGIVSLGGEQSVLDLERDPLLGEERDWLREAVALGVPVLGICLGAQLLAAALGGAVYRLRRPNLGWKPTELTREGAGDRIVGAGDAPVALLWNHDAIVPPPDAVELVRAAGEGCVAFRHGARAWGLQFHPEVTAEALDDWWVRWGPAQLAESGVDEALARAGDARHLGGQRALSASVFGRFATLVGEDERSRPAARR
jgi:GMP synthase-like glutamine amidotransferase